MTCSVDGCDWVGLAGCRGEGKEKELRVPVFFLDSLYFLPGVSRFGCGLRAQRIDARFYSRDTLLHL